MKREISLALLAAGVMMVAWAVLLIFGGPTQVAAQGDGLPDFVGSDACADCHTTEAAQHALHGHNWKLNRVVDGQPPAYPFSEIASPPAGYEWSDVAFVIGGFAWKARFIDNQGYIITGAEDAVTQYNLPLVDERTGDVIVEAGWVPYHAGEEVPYDCGGCHTTGYNHDPSTNMYDLPGMVGMWEEEGVQCEECHGAGSLHIQDPIRVDMIVNTSSEACGRCHFRGVEGVVESADGFINHHEQYEELSSTPHAAFECIDCHNPHQSAVYADEAVNPNRSLRVTCTDCHYDNLVTADHADNGVTCTDCHMPPMTASGSRSAELLWADVSTHLFQINTDYEAPQFNEDGTAVMPYISIEYACRRCHVENQWTPRALSIIAEDFHQRGQE